jgi:hypothetical protein
MVVTACTVYETCGWGAGLKVYLDAELGKLTLKSNGNEALSDESP